MQTEKTLQFHRMPKSIDAKPVQIFIWLIEKLCEKMIIYDT